MSRTVSVAVPYWQDDIRAVFTVTAEVPDSVDAPYAFLAVTDDRGRDVEPGRGPLHDALWEAVDREAGKEVVT